MREDLGETTLRRSGFNSGTGTPSRRASLIAQKKNNATSVAEGISGSRLGRRLSDLISDLGTLSLTPMVDRRRSTVTTPAITEIQESSDDELESENNSTATPRRPASGITSLPFRSTNVSRNNSSTGLSSLETSLVVSTSTPGPSRRASSATLPPLGPVPSPSLGWTPSAPLFLDWPKLYRERFILDQRWQEGEPHLRVLSGHSDSVYCLQFDEGKIITGSVRFFFIFW